MKKRFALSLVLVSLTLAMLAFPSPEVPDLVPADPFGTIEGTFSVSADGAATYEIPLEVPPGTRELRPKLTLTYNSQRDNGILGMGWALNGIENIARCNATQVPDGFTEAVSYTYRDRFCMAGMQLIATSGEYGHEGTEYRTVRDTWTRIVSHGTCGQGPCWFSARNKDGAELRFGFTTGATGSRILATGRTDGAVRVWSQDRYTDLNSNYVSVSYFNDTTLGEYYPARVEYGGNDRTGLEPQREVSFEYEPRPDRISSYSGGSPFQVLHRMTHVKTRVGKTLVKNYVIRYKTSPSTGRSRLASIQDCTTETPSSTTCLPATTFELSGPPNGFSAGSTTPTGQSPSKVLSLLPMDVNGDGKSDFVDAWNDSGDLQLTTWLSTGTSLGPASTQDTHTKAGDLGILGMDVTGDLRGDVVMPTGEGGFLSLYVFLSTGDGFGTGVRTATQRPPEALSYMPADVAADGIQDVVQVIDQSGKVGFVVFPSSGTGSFGEAVTSSSDFDADNQGFFPLDVNGDGRMDVVQVQENETVEFIVYLSNGRAFDRGSAVSTGRSPADFEVEAGDVNGDGLADLMLLEEQPSTVEVTPFLSTGKSFRNVTSTVLEAGEANLGIFSATLNGDSRNDLLQLLENNGTVRFLPYYGNGTTFDAGTAFHSQLSPESLGPRLLDLDGDGKQDVLDPHENGHLELSLVLNKVGQPDLLNRVVNGLGGEVLVTHKPMTDSSLYTKGVGAEYPVVDVQTSLPLVAAYTNTDGRDGKYSFTYHYDQGQIGYGGTGWLGFRAVKMIQDSNGRFSEVLYDQTYPANGLVTKNGTYNRDGVSLAITDLSYADVASDSLKARGIHQYVPTSESYSAYDDDHGGARLYTLERTYEYDDYGNVRQISDLGQPGITTDDRFTCFRYDNDPEQWRLGYVTQKLLARTDARCQDFQASPEPTWDPRTDVNWQEMRYDDRMNLAESAVWDDSHDVWVRSSSTFDAYGNVLSNTDPAGNTTSFEYDTTYHTFLARMTSPPNEAGERLVDTFEFEPFFGNQVRNVDANGNLFTWSVDTLGRMVDEYGPAPGGSPTEPVRLRHASFGKDATGFFAKVSSRPEWSAGDDPVNWFWETTYTDGLLREWRTETRGATAQTATVNELRFNAEGQVSHTSLPFFADQTPSFIVTTYDVYNRPTTVTQPDGTVQKFDYLLSGLKVRTTDAFGTSEERTEISQFDSYGQLISQTLSNGEVYCYQYNLMGELVRIETLPERRQVDFIYDSLGRLRSTSTSDTGTTSFHWNAFNQMTGSTDADDNTLSYTYDALGRIVTSVGTTAAGSETVRLTYDGLTSNGKGNLTRAQLNRSPLGDYSYELGYDPYKQTRTVRVALGGQPYTYAMDYTPLGQLSGQAYPDGSQLTVSYRADANPGRFDFAAGEGRTETYLTYDDYDANDVPLSTLSKNGVETTRVFYPNDVATGKLKTVTAKRGTTMLFGNEYTWNRFDFVESVRDLTAARGDEDYEYDALGFLTGAQGPYGEQDYEYDQVGNRKKHNDVEYTYADGRDWLSSYGPVDSNRLSNLSWNHNGTLKSLVKASGSFDFSYDAQGRVVGITRAGVKQPGTMAYDFADNQVFYQPIGSTTRFYGISSDYEIADYGNGKVLATKYIDGLFGRAVAITTPAAPPPAAHQHAMMARIYQGTASWCTALLAAGHGVLAHLLRPAVAQALILGLALLPVVAAGAGSVVLARRRGRSAPTLWARERPVVAAGVPWVSVLVLLLATPTPIDAALTPGANGPGNPTEGTLYFVQDLVEDTVLVTDGTGQVSASVRYLPFGGVDPVASEGTDNFQPKFTGKTYDTDSGLYFFGQRYYNPEVGRFITPDPAAQYINPYVLGANNPTSQIDPNGEFALLATIIIGAVVGAYMGAAAVNQDANPIHWDWTSGKTYGGLLGGALIGGLGGAAVSAAAATSATAGIAGAVVVGAGENAAFTAMGGGSGKEIFAAAVEGVVFGALFGGVGAAVTGVFSDVVDLVEIGFDVTSTINQYRDSSDGSEVFHRRPNTHASGGGSIKRAVNEVRPASRHGVQERGLGFETFDNYSRGKNVEVGTKGWLVSISTWKLDEVGASYQELLWRVAKSPKSTPWNNLTEISSYAPNLRYLTMSQNVSHSFEPTAVQGRMAAVQILDNPE